MYSCEICNYETSRFLNFQRHGIRKRPCNPKITNYETIPDGVDDTIDDGKEVHAEHDDGNKVHDDGKEVHAEHDDGTEVQFEGDSITKLQCEKCDKVFQSKKGLNGHKKKCEGLDKKQCRICLKLFTTKQGKYNHKQYVKCTPPQIATAPTNCSINNGTINNINNINNNTTINNTINIIQGRLSFGKENLEDLCKDPLYVERMFSHISEGGSYALVRSMDDIFFNDKYPNNQTIKKTRKNDSLVEVYQDGNWIKKYLKDVFTPINQKIEDYYDPFFETRFTKRLPPTHPRYKQLLRFAGQMKEQGWTCNAIEESIDTIVEEPSGVEAKRKQKETMRLMLDNTYDQSKRTKLALGSDTRKKI